MAVRLRATDRGMRHPTHTWHLVQRPWQIQPFLVAPVLPGETLRNLVHQSRVVTDPINSKLIGWWCEYYYYYCRLTDLDQGSTVSANVQELMLNPAFAPAAIQTATADPACYIQDTNRVNFTRACLNKVVQDWFRIGDEVYSSPLIDTLPAAALSQEDWMNSLWPESEYASADVSVSTAGDNAFTMREIDDAMSRWNYLREYGLTDMTYEDWLRSFGVKTPTVDRHVPEMLRYVREWQYPSNTVNPSTGQVVSAVSWSIQERADKDRFFKEPGFVFGVSVIRPKVYKSGQKNSATCMLDNGNMWLPAILAGDPEISLKALAPNTYTGVQTVAAVADLADLYRYGEQFLNEAPGDNLDRNAVASPPGALTETTRRFPSADDADNLFVTPAGLNRVRQDGVAKLHISTSIGRDRTVKGGRVSVTM